MTEHVTELELNGKKIEIRDREDRTLLRVLRDDLRLTGTKDGCSEGHCGTCTVLIDGKPELSCQVRVRELKGRRVQTIEGLSQDGNLHPIQQAFVEAGAIQCGFCTPGMILSAKALLDQNPHPTEEDIRRGLARNICRCGGYVKIIDAVGRAADDMAGGSTKKTADPSVGKGALGQSMLKADAYPKAKGEMVFADDIYLDHMMHGKVLWSEYPSAEIEGIDTSEAEKMPGVEIVLTHNSIPGRKIFGWPAPNYPQDQPLLAIDRVRCVSDAVAAVFADTKEAAEEAVKRIKVHYRPTKGVFTVEEAMAPGSPKVHGQDNLLNRFRIRKGDVERAFSEAAAIAEGTFFTPFVEHAALEPEATVAALNEEGGITVWNPTQSNRVDRLHIAQALNLPEEKVRVIQMPLGGAFGGRIEQLAVPSLPSLAAFLTGRPAKLVLNRREVMRIHPKRHAFTMKYKVSADREGRLTGVRAQLMADTGAYGLTAVLLIEQALANSCGPYVVGSVLAEGDLIYTNNIPSGAFRGYGANQPTFAFESLVEELAHKLGMDPYEMRMKNLLDVGSATCTGHILRDYVGIKPSLKAAKEALGDVPASKGKKKIGVGMACGLRGTGAGLGAKWPTGAVLELKPDGRLLLRIGCADIGQGSETVFRQIAAETTGVRFNLIDILAGDTSLTPEGSRIAASRQTIQTGNAVLMAAEEFKTMLKHYVAEHQGLDINSVDIRDDRLVEMESGKVLMTLEEAADTSTKNGMEIKAEKEYNHPQTYHLSEDVDAVIASGGKVHYMAYAYTACIAVVEVDEETGAVKVLKLISANEVGRPMNPLSLDGQIEGSVIQGMGYALSEEFKTKEGFPLTNTIAQCRVPKIRQIPEIVPIAVDARDPVGPYGAKGVGEIAILPVPPAITNAIFNAVGVRVTDLPATREKVARLLRRGKGPDGHGAS